MLVLDTVKPVQGVQFVAFGDSGDVTRSGDILIRRGHRVALDILGEMLEYLLSRQSVCVGLGTNSDLDDEEVAGGGGNAEPTIGVCDLRGPC